MITDDESIREQDDSPTTYESADDASNAFLKQWDVAEEPTEHVEGASDKAERDTATDHDDDQEELEEYIDDTDESDEDPQDTTEATYVESEDARVKIKVNGEEVEASIKDLKRLYGQEASLTHKSQEVAQQRKQIEEKAAQYETALETLVKRAEERYKPYANIDFLVAAKQLDADELTALRQEAVKAYEDLNFLQGELKQVHETKAQSENAQYMEKAKAAIEYLSDPEKGIPNWGEALYNDIRTHAVEQGMDMAVFNKITDPVMLKTMWKAMRYDKAKKASAKKVATAPSKVLKSKAPATRNQMGREGNAKAMQRLRSEGSRDAAVDAFMSRWEATSD